MHSYQKQLNGQKGQKKAHISKYSCQDDRCIKTLLLSATSIFFQIEGLSVILKSNFTQSETNGT